MVVINATGLFEWIANPGLGAELEQSFVAIEHEVAVSGAQLGSEGTLTGEEEIPTGPVWKSCTLIPSNALVDEAVYEEGTKR